MGLREGAGDADNAAAFGFLLAGQEERAEETSTENQLLLHFIDYIIPNL